MRGTSGNAGVYKNGYWMRGLMCQSGVPDLLPKGWVGARWGSAGNKKGFRAVLALPSNSLGVNLEI
jgi:hypothetical protein